MSRPAGAASGLDASIVVPRGEFILDAAVSAARGEVVALIGPNGSGKSTLLGALAGLRRPSRGRVELDGAVLDDVSTGAHVAARDRGVGLVVQDYLLFPRMSVVENVAFGLRARGVSRVVARDRAGRWLQRMGLHGLEPRRPGELSGGQAQRVALARALIAEPALLLLDEPLAALDAGTRPSVRAELRRHLADYRGCTVVVTHDPLEAMVLGDRVVVLEAGQVVQEGAPAEVARHPRTDYVARLVGLNLLAGVADGRQAAIAGRSDGARALRKAAPPGKDAAPGEDVVNTVDLAVSPGASVVLAHEQYGPVHVAFSPAAVTLSLRRPDGSARNAWLGTVLDLERHGDLVRVTVDGPVPLLADVTPVAVAELGLAPGLAVWASVKATEITAYPR